MTLNILKEYCTLSLWRIFACFLYNYYLHSNVKMRIIKLKIAPLSRTISSKMKIIQCMFNVSFLAFPIHCYVSRNNSLAIPKRKNMVNAYVGIKLNVPYTYSIYIYIACSSYALPIREFSCFSLSLSPGFGHLNQELKYCNFIRPSAHRLF